MSDNIDTKPLEEISITDGGFISSNEMNSYLFQLYETEHRIKSFMEAQINRVLNYLEEKELSISQLEERIKKLEDKFDELEIKDSHEKKKASSTPLIRTRDQIGLPKSTTGKKKVALSCTPPNTPSTKKEEPILEEKTKEEYQTISHEETIQKIERSPSHVSEFSEFDEFIVPNPFSAPDGFEGSAIIDINYEHLNELKPWDFQRNDYY